MPSYLVVMDETEEARAALRFAARRAAKPRKHRAKPRYHRPAPPPPGERG